MMNTADAEQAGHLARGLGRGSIALLRASRSGIDSGEISTRSAQAAGSTGGPAASQPVLRRCWRNFDAECFEPLDRLVAYRSYNHRLKRAIADSGDLGLFPELNIPRSTARGWIRHGVPDVVTAKDLDLDAQALLVRNRELQHERNCATQQLASFTFKLFGLQIQYRRLPNSVVLVSSPRLTETAWHCCRTCSPSPRRSHSLTARASSIGNHVVE